MGSPTLHRGAGEWHAAARWRYGSIRKKEAPGGWYMSSCTEQCSAAENAGLKAPPQQCSGDNSDRTGLMCQRSKVHPVHLQGVCVFRRLAAEGVRHLEQPLAARATVA